jgi:RNA polymerase sigma factor (sigma-70 family)
VDQLTNVSAPPGPDTDPAAGVTALYEAHALGLLHLAVIMIGDRARRQPVVFTEVDTESAETRALIGEEHREVLAALRRLPDRQREVVALRCCLDLSPEDVAAAMGISQGTVKSASSRGLATLGRMLKGTE